MRTATEILAIGERNASALLPGEAASVKAEFRKLANAWHPDHSADPMASAVFAHLTVLKAAALRALGKGKAAPEASKSRDYATVGGKSYRLRYATLGSGPLGDVLAGRTHVAYEFMAGFEDVAAAEKANAEGLRFADAGMRKEMERFLPGKVSLLDLGGGKRVAVHAKPEAAVLLGDLVGHMGGRIDPVHVAWIVSGLLNVASYLHWAQAAHGAIGPETVIVSPETHSVGLLGGWGFATAYGKRPAALPERTTSVVPRLALKGEAADARVDLHLVRAVAQDALGCPGGGGLAMDSSVPEAMRQWLLLPPEENAWKDYAGWNACLERSFGKRRFVDMGVKASAIYPKP